MPEFERVCARAAVKINNGSLKLERGFSQISRRAWPFLAGMNTNDYMTYDSQGGSGKNERAYVMGIMRRTRGKRFTELMNLRTNFVSMVIAESTDKLGSNIAVTNSEDGEGMTRLTYADKNVHHEMNNMCRVVRRRIFHTLKVHLNWELLVNNVLLGSQIYAAAQP
jgi:hypothetical protein